VKPDKIKWALLGGGADSLIGIVHRIAASMGDDFQLIGGLFNTDVGASRQFARDLGLDPRRAYESLDALIAAENALPEADRVKVVTTCISRWPAS
jgi:predicted dehydrogenase